MSSIQKKRLAVITFLSCTLLGLVVVWKGTRSGTLSARSLVKTRAVVPALTPWCAAGGVAAFVTGIWLGRRFGRPLKHVYSPPKWAPNDTLAHLKRRFCGYKAVGYPTPPYDPKTTLVRWRWPLKKKRPKIPSQEGVNNKTTTPNVSKETSDGHKQVNKGPGPAVESSQNPLPEFKRKQQQVADEQMEKSRAADEILRYAEGTVSTAENNLEIAQKTKDPTEINKAQQKLTQANNALAKARRGRF